MGIENFSAFLPMAVIFVMIPGMDTLFVLNKAISQGKRSGIYASIGVNFGVIVHALIGAFGLTLLLSRFPDALNIIKYAGAGYVFFLGVKTMKSASKMRKAEALTQQHAQNSFIAGFINNVLNPKVALFFIAFFPQFISITALDRPWPFLMLGGTYMVLGLIWFSLLAFLAGRLNKNLQKNEKIMKRSSLISGGIFILMALLMLIF